MVTVIIDLFSKPDAEFGMQAENIQPAHIDAKADSLHKRLHSVADTLRTLNKDGWSGDVTVYDVALFHPDVKTPRQATKRFQALGLDWKKAGICVLDVEENEWL